MSISLEKRSNTAVISLQKVLQTAADQGRDLGELTAQIILVIDHSGSMEFPENQFYTRGEIQDLSERVLALSLSGLDDDGNIQIFPFDSYAYEPFEVDQTNYEGCIERWRYVETDAVTEAPKKLFGRSSAPTITKQRVLRRMGGTDYSAVIDKVINFATSNGMLAKSNPPILVIFQTDGLSSDMGLVKKKLTQAATLPIFWQFLGLGQNTAFLEELDDLPNRAVDNVGFFGVSSTTKLSDEEFYDKIIAEFFPKWLPAARQAGIVTA